MALNYVNPYSEYPRKGVQCFFSCTVNRSEKVQETNARLDVGTIVR